MVYWKWDLRGQAPVLILSGILLAARFFIAEAFYWNFSTTKAMKNEIRARVGQTVFL